MIRQTFCAGLFLAILGSFAGQVSYGQAGGASDKIYYRDKDGTVKPVIGELKETNPGVFQVVSGGKPVTDGKTTLEFTAAEIVRVLPGADFPGLPRDKLLNLDGLETGKEYPTARPKYEEALKTPGLRGPAKQFLETRSLLLRARLHEEADEEARKGESAQLAGELNSYLDAYTKGWEFWHIGRALARVHADAGRQAEVARTWGRLAASPNLARDLRDDAALRNIDALIRDGKYDEAAAKTAELSKSPPAGTGAKDRLAIYLAASKGAANLAASSKEIEAVIARTKDPLARASGYAMLGELNLAAKKYREAMWAYLWVEVVFNQDRDEVINAMTRLAMIFDAMGDKDRAESYKERIRKYRSEA